MNGDFFNSQQQKFIPGTKVEVAKKPKGRPRGSKNKPRVVLPLVPRDGGNVMAPCFLEVPNGNDIIRAISQFSIRKSIGLYVLMASAQSLTHSFYSSHCLYRPSRHPLHVRRIRSYTIPHCQSRPQSPHR
ncbi:hypothetical protein K1719_000405 [Acacia pycnantha]|nr:hypothetical protein K1719_000405 [Acacia pycnantha]